MNNLRRLFEETIRLENVPDCLLNQIRQELAGEAVTAHLRRETVVLAARLNRGIPSEILNKWINDSRNLLYVEAQYLPDYSHPLITLEDFLRVSIYASTDLIFAAEGALEAQLQPQGNLTHRDFWTFAQSVLTNETLFRVFSARFRAFFNYRRDGGLLNLAAYPVVWLDIAYAHSLRSSYAALCVYVKAWHTLLNSYEWSHIC